MLIFDEVPRVRLGVIPGALLDQYLCVWRGWKAISLSIFLYGLTGAVLFAQDRQDRPSPIRPTTLSAAQLPKLIKSLPKYSPFSLSGLAFFKGSLYSGSNLGIVEIHDGSVSGLLRFHRSNSVVSRIVLDVANQTLWADDDETGEFLRFDGSRWTHIKWPPSPKGHYTRAEVGMEPRLIGDYEGLWLTVGGCGWTWNEPTMKWVPVNSSALEGVDCSAGLGINGIGLIGILPIGPAPLMIVRHQGRFVGGRRGQKISLSDEIVDPTGSSQQIKREGQPFMADTWAVAKDADYICTTDHTLIRVTKELVAPLSAPGECEVVSNDEEMNLIASIKSKGVFRYSARDGWTLLAQSPYPSGDGEYWTYIAASNGRLALAIDAQPVVDRGRTTTDKMYFTRNAPTSLWVSHGGPFVPVPY